LLYNKGNYILLIPPSTQSHLDSFIRKSYRLTVYFCPAVHCFWRGFNITLNVHAASGRCGHQLIGHLDHRMNWKINSDTPPQRHGNRDEIICTIMIIIITTVCHSKDIGAKIYGLLVGVLYGRIGSKSVVITKLNFPLMNRIAQQGWSGWCTDVHTMHIITHRYTQLLVHTLTHTYTHKN